MSTILSSSQELDVLIVKYYKSPTPELKREIEDKQQEFNEFIRGI